ncbi:MAG: DUF166 family protein [Promethearchaeota archaeon]
MLSDGKYGDRAAQVVKNKFPETRFIIMEERNASEIIDDVKLEDNVESAIKESDLLIVYVRHADVVAEICSRQKPTILPIDFGEGFLRQVKDMNPQIIMPISMCNALPDTGIKEIDEYFNKFGSPVYKINIKISNNEKAIIKEAKLLIESPCGASNSSLEQIQGKELSLETLNSFAINIRQECREPVSFLLSHKDMSDSSASLHLLNLLNALEKEAPSLFLPDTTLGRYAIKRREEYRTNKLKHLF